MSGSLVRRDGTIVIPPDVCDDMLHLGIASDSRLLHRRLCTLQRQGTEGPCRLIQTAHQAGEYDERPLP